VCDQGTFAGETGLSECEDCAPGKFNVDVDASNPTVNDHDNIGDCESCPGERAKYCEQAFCKTSILAMKCAKWLQTQRLHPSTTKLTHSIRLARFTCFARPSFKNAHNLASLGAAGKNSVNPGAPECALCGVGKMSFISSSECTLCAAGKYGPSTGLPTCQNCAAGRYSGTVGTTDCTTCAAGTYQSAIGRDSCVLCEGGKYSVTPISTPGFITSCVTCTAGTYALPAEGATSCESCPAGYFSPAGAYSSCTPCQSNTYNTESGSTYCSNCPPSQSSPEGSTSCSTCPGVIVMGVGCVECTAGQYAAAVGCNNCYGGSRSSGGAGGRAKRASFYEDESTRDKSHQNGYRRNITTSTTKLN